MPTFTHGDTTISYLDEGTGDPVVLVHGFASNKEANWIFPGWIAPLREAGYRVIAFDHRGHGASTKHYDTARYSVAEMAGDVIALLDHLKIEKADLVGYSMGARVSAYVAAHFPSRVRSATLGGMGMSLVRPAPANTEIAEAMEATNDSDVTDPMAIRFRKFAQQTKSDLKALAALSRSNERILDRTAAAGITVPVLIVVGTEDDVSGSGEELSHLIPGSKFVPLERRDHMRTVGDMRFKQAVIDFLRERP